MNRRIEITEVEPRRRPEDIQVDQMVVDDALTGLRPWVEALVAAIGSEDDEQRLIAACESVDDLRQGGDPHRGAAELAAELAGDDSATGEQRRAAVAAGLYLLKRRGFEAGRSEASHWRINRVLNTGSAALDVMLDDPTFRPLSLQTLFYRVLKTAFGRADVGPGGAITEVSCGVDWNRQAGQPRRHRLPDASGGEAGDEIVDWLLEQLLARGLSSLTLGSVVEEHRERRSWEIDDAFGRWLEELSADEARFGAGVLFCPARLGGWRTDVEERLLDVFGVARTIDEDFVPDDDRADVYRTHLQRLEKLRRIPERLSTTYRLDDGETSWRGRWGVSVHPVRRRRGDDRAFFVMEAGFYFDDEQGGASKWGRVKSRNLRQELNKGLERLDDQLFTEFSQCLDQVVEQLNSAPAAVLGEDAGRLSSPLWENLQEGVAEVDAALRDGEVDELTAAFRRWTVRCEAPA